MAKYLDGREAELFSVPLDPPSPLTRPARPRLIGRLPGFTEPATGAGLSQDRTLLAVCSSRVTRIYRRGHAQSPPWRLLGEVRYESLPIEGIGWDGRDLVLVAEGGGFYRLSEKTWRARSPRESRRATGRATKGSRRRSAGSEVMSEPQDVVIVGGGVIGLSIAYAVAREGIVPTVLDRRELGREASWAGAGLIPPEAEHPTEQPRIALRAWSARLYPSWSTALQEETGTDSGYRRTGGVDVAWTDQEATALWAAAGRWRAEGVAHERLAPGDYARVEPALNPELKAVYYLPDRAQVRSPRLLRALMAAVTRRGGRLKPWHSVEGFEVHGGRVTAVRTAAGDLPCGMVVVAAGAWSGSLLEPIVHAPTPPLKGQIVLLRGDRPLIERIVEHGTNYLVPRDDGLILVGATEENVGFDTQPTALAARGLLDHALRLCPSLSQAKVEATWAGLRPGSVDTRPYIGTAPGFPNLIVAAGHRRAGLQLAPATAEIVADLVLGRRPRLDIGPFRLGREPDPTEDETFRS